jgi:uncharacterized phage-associated protein
MNGDDNAIDYNQLGTSFDELVAPFEASWTPALRQFGEELSAHFLFQSRLLELRKSLGLTQAEAGRVAGEAQSEISRMERGQVVPSVDRAVGIIARLKSHGTERAAVTASQSAAPSKSSPMYRAIDVARYLLAHQDQYDAMSTLKLQKLLYFAQGTFLATLGRPLFVDQMRAWKHGPVVPGVWRTYSEYKDGVPLPRPDDFDDSIFDPETRALLDAVYQKWGGLDAWKLRSITHSEGPWVTTPPQAIIEQQAIADYFVSLRDRPRA